jgi:hypothetical protein
MPELLQRRWSGDYLKMADELGHAAIPLGSVPTGFAFLKSRPRDAQTGVWYSGGELRTLEQLTHCPEPDYDAIRQRLIPLRQRCADAGIACWLVLPWCFHVIATQMGLEHFALACYDEPEMVRQAMAAVEARTAKSIARVVAEVRPDFVLFDGDCAYKQGTMVHPDLLRELTYAPTLPNVRALRQLDIPIAFHSDGKLDGVVPLLLDLGVAAVHGCEKQANDLGHLVDAFGDRIVLCGNMDVVFLNEATPQQVRDEAHAMLAIGWRKGKFVACCNTSPQDYIPEANYRALLSAVEAWRP